MPGVIFSNTSWRESFLGDLSCEGTLLRSHGQPVPSDWPLKRFWPHWYIFIRTMPSRIEMDRGTTLAEGIETGGWLLAYFTNVVSAQSFPSFFLFFPPVCVSGFRWTDGNTNEPKLSMSTYPCELLSRDAIENRDFFWKIPCVPSIDRPRIKQQFVTKL